MTEEKPQTPQEFRYVPASEQEAYITQQLLKLQEGRKLKKVDPHFLQRGSSAAGKSNPKENVDETSEST